ncbi:MAG TPA: hypothetical protein PKD05_12130 [Candidatus Melainabacteria bacterium]|nr:hypothetical protein [Candidatus Melainabacteria bacterium]
MNSHKVLLTTLSILSLVTLQAEAAENISMRKGVSFVEDKDNDFPIIADKLEDVHIEPGKTNFIFFGASGDLNTARQAKRLVGSYNKLRDRDVKFIVINVDKPASKEAEGLIKKYYKGYIPCQTVIDSGGTTTWSKVGEVSENEVTKQISKNLKR